MAKKAKASNEFEFRHSSRTRVRFIFREFKGNKFLDCRAWYLDDNDEFQPGKGFTVKIEKAQDFLAALAEWAASAEIPEEKPAKTIKEESKAEKPTKSKGGRPIAKGKTKAVPAEETWEE